MRVLIIDDIDSARARLQRLLSDSAYEVFDTASPKKALEEHCADPFSIALLDIEMPSTNGLVLAQQLLDTAPETAIIFVTAFSDYALEAFEAGGVGYLLKPVSKEALLCKIDQFTSRKAQPKSDVKPFLVRFNDKVYLCKPEEIIYVKADLDEVIIRTKEYQGYLTKRFGDIEAILNSNNFFKIHRSLLVNLDTIKSYKTAEQSKIVISFHGINDTLTSSKEGAKRFRQYFEQ